MGQYLCTCLNPFQTICYQNDPSQMFLLLDIAKIIHLAIQSNSIFNQIVEICELFKTNSKEMKFRQFLQGLAKITTKEISRFVIGNPSVDYDSFFGSILLAYVLTSATGQFHQPIIDCRRQELGLRFEIQAVLQKVKIDPSVFHFRESAKENYLEGVYSLYDHNFRQGINNVQFIVDHHAYSPDQLKTNKYLIDNMGSGLTIIYYLLAQSKLNLLKLEQNHHGHSFLQKYSNFVAGTPFEGLKDSELIDQSINEIIRYGILIDTFNFDAKQKERWTIFDKRAVEFIQAEQKFQKGHQWIQSLKFNKQRNKRMTLHQSLVKDRKNYTYDKIKVTYSIIYLSPHEFYSHYHSQMQIEFGADRQQSDVYFLMSLYHSNQGPFKRQIMYKINNKDQQKTIQQALDKCLQSQKMIKFGKIQGEWHHWIDPSAVISRKKLEPLIKQAILNMNAISQI